MHMYLAASFSNFLNFQAKPFWGGGEGGGHFQEAPPNLELIRNFFYLLLKVPPFLPGRGGGKDGGLATIVPLKPVSQTLDRGTITKHDGGGFRLDLTTPCLSSDQWVRRTVGKELSESC